jgi:hypothetical protein
MLMIGRELLCWMFFIFADVSTVWGSLRTMVASSMEMPILICRLARVATLYFGRRRRWKSRSLPRSLEKSLWMGGSCTLKYLSFMPFHSRLYTQLSQTPALEVHTAHKIASFMQERKLHMRLQAVFETLQSFATLNTYVCGFGYKYYLANRTPIMFSRHQLHIPPPTIQYTASPIGLHSPPSYSDNARPCTECYSHKSVATSLLCDRDRSWRRD